MSIERLQDTRLIQKNAIVFLHTTNEQLKFELKIPFIIVPRIKKKYLDSMYMITRRKLQNIDKRHQSISK